MNKWRFILKYYTIYLSSHSQNIWLYQMLHIAVPYVPLLECYFYVSLKITAIFTKHIWLICILSQPYTYNLWLCQMSHTTVPKAPTMERFYESLEVKIRFHIFSDRNKFLLSTVGVKLLCKKCASSTRICVTFTQVWEYAIIENICGNCNNHVHCLGIHSLIVELKLKLRITFLNTTHCVFLGG